MVTINDVAKAAGVSNATASRALRNTAKLRPSTVARVKKAAADLGYVVNTTAQSLKSSTRNRVGLIVSDITNEYYHYIQASIEDALEKMNYQLTITFSSENPVDEKKAFETLIGTGAGFIFFTPTCATNKKIIDIALKNGIRVIQLFRNIYPNLPSIINDDEGGSYKAAKKLIDDGKKNVLLFDVDYEFLDYRTVRPNRSLGFQKAIDESRGVKGNVVRLLIGKDNKEEIKKAINEHSPDGIIAASGAFGYEILSCLQDLDRKAELITYDDNKWFKYLGVSAIHQDLDQLSNAITGFIADKSREDSIIIDEKVEAR
jgi:DNA-binding LacI/PurR family transcriptional regulator